MTTLIEAAKQALEALNKNLGELRIAGARHILRTAIEQAEKQEPVADGLIRSYICALVADKPDEAAEVTKRMVDYVFATPPAAQRQPLTDEQIMQTWEGIIKYAPGEVRLKDFARAIEAAHGIKEKSNGN